MSSSATTDLTGLAALPRWKAARVEALAGRCRGSLVAHWADNVRRRFGADAVGRVRERMGSLSATLPDDPPPRSWIPVAASVRVTDVVIDELLGGDALALEPLLHEDVARSRSRVLWAVVRRVPIGTLLGQTHRAHPHLYDAVGRAEADVHKTSAIVRYEGAALFGNPTWQLLQLMGFRVLLSLMRRDVVELVADRPSDDAFTAWVHWR